MFRYLIKNPFFILLVVLLYVANSGSHPTQNGGYTGAPGDGVCAQCHSGNNSSFNGEINIDGIPSTVVPGQAYDITVTVTNINLNANRAGFQITALNSSNQKAGNMTENDPNASLKNSAGRQYFGHAPAQEFNGGGSVSWQATWTAPTTGSGQITFYCASILGNGSGSSGDKFLLNQVVTNLPAAPLSVTLNNVENVSCFNGNDGTATATPSGGQSPYQYSWSNGATTQTVNNLTAGLATVIVTDNNGNTTSASVNITQPSALTLASANANNPTCFNNNDGSISITISGGSPPYTYDWSNGSNTSSLLNIGVGTYQVTVTDFNDCEFIASFTLTAPPAIQITDTNITNVSCFGQSNGAIQISTTGGVGNLSYEWSNGATTQNLNNVPAGQYTLVITDGNHCELEQMFNISQPPQLVSQITVNSNIICNNNTTGSLTASGAGGVSPYTYSWSNGSTNATINNLSANTYTVIIKDQNNCTSQKSETLINPPVLIASTSSITNASCPAINNGSATIQVSGGVSPYTTLWSNGTNGNNLTNVSAGTYTYNVTDNYGCTVSGQVTIGSNPAAELIEDTVTPLECFGDNNAAISIIANNSAGYNIIWSNGQSGTSIENLSAGIYSVQASNPQGCISNQLSFEIESPEAIVLLQDQVTQINCFGANNGSIATLFNGGTGQLSFAWNTGQSTSTIDNLSPNMYNIVVTDENNCSVNKSYVISQPTAIEIDTFAIQNLNCYNESNGIIHIVPMGGTGNLQAVWSNGDIGNTSDSLSLGLQTVIITDANNCLLYDTFLITSPIPMEIQGTVINESGTGQNNGSISVTVSNGIAPYKYLWSTGDTTAMIDSLSPGFYELIVTDSTGCSQNGQFNIQSGNCALAATYEVIDATCNGSNDGQVLFTPFNGGEPYTISPPPVNLTAGNYMFTISDTNNCSITINNIVVNEPLAINIKLDTIIPSTTNVSNDGQIKVTIIGGSDPYNYIWSDSLGNIVDSLEDLRDLAPGIYSLEVMDANGCTIVSQDYEVTFTSSNQEIEYDNAEFKVYPNPATDRIYITSNIASYTMQLFDIQGKLIDKYYLNAKDNNIDVSHLNSGIFVMKILIADKTITKKIIIE